MAKFKLTKGELKRQRDALRQYQRYLPTLQLKKQQLQLEILQQHYLLDEKLKNFALKKNAAHVWAGLLNEPEIDLRSLLKLSKVNYSQKNVAGVDIPVFSSAEFTLEDYDLFLLPFWVDFAIEAFKVLISLEEEIKMMGKAIALLKHELRITTQRVNLFEKVKIPDAEEAIRLIKIYIGDQMANAVGRSKIAKSKIEAELAGVAV